MALYKESLINTIEADLAGRNQNWNDLEKFMQHKSILVELNAAQTIPNNTNTIVNLGIIRRQYGNAFFWSPDNPSRIVVGAGVSKVRVRAQVGWVPNETGNRQLYIYKNGSGVFFPYLSETVKAANTLSSGLFGTVQSIYSPALPVQEGDYFEMMVRQNSGGDLNVTQNNGATGLYLEVVE